MVNMNEQKVIDELSIKYLFNELNNKEKEDALNMLFRWYNEYLYHRKKLLLEVEQYGKTL